MGKAQHSTWLAGGHWLFQIRARCGGCRLVQDQLWIRLRLRLWLRLRLRLRLMLWLRLRLKLRIRMVLA